MTLAEVDWCCRAMAASLRAAGVERGSRVLVFSRDNLDTVLAWFAISLLGGVEIPINHGLHGRILENLVNAADADLMVVDAALLPVIAAAEPGLTKLRTLLVIGQDTATSNARLGRLITSNLLSDEMVALDPDNMPEVHPTDLSSILYSSGTSGSPKGVLIPHAQAVLTAAVTAEQLEVRADDVFYCCHPMFHMAGKHCVVLGGLLAGACVHLDDRFRAETWLDNIRTCGATVTISHGPMVEMVFRQPERPDDAENPLRRFITSPFPKAIAAAFERRFGVRGLEAWGMTEVGIPCWSRLSEPLDPGSCGRPVDAWYEMRVGDPETDLELPDGNIGEFMVRPRLPSTIMQGYFGNDTSTLRAWRNLWFHSGDLGYRDAQGVFHFVDRNSDRIRRRAENVSSFDIESIANEHPAVLETAAVGVPSGYDQDDDIKLFVVPRAGAVVDPAELVVALARSLPHYMVPRYIAVVGELPRTPTNKVQKSTLKTSSAESWDRHAEGLRLRELTAPAAPRPRDT